MIASDTDVRNVGYLNATEISVCGGPISGNATTHEPLYFDQWYNRVSPPETCFNWTLNSKSFETRYESMKTVYHDRMLVPPAQCAGLLMWIRLLSLAACQIY